jgi:hypothetical protein
MAALAIGIIGALPAILPAVEDAVKLVESFFQHKPKSGAQKLQAAQSIVGDLLNVYGGVAPAIPGAPQSSSSAVQADIAELINAVVKLMNDLGAFHKSA